MVRICPYCESKFYDKSYLYRHVLSKHSRPVLAHWIDQHDVSPLRSGQQQIEQVVA